MLRIHANVLRMTVVRERTCTCDEKYISAMIDDDDLGKIDGRGRRICQQKNVLLTLENIITIILIRIIKRTVVFILLQNISIHG